MSFRILVFAENMALSFLATGLLAILFIREKETEKVFR